MLLRGISRAESVLGQTEEICHEEEAADKTDPGQDELAHFSHADTVDKKSRHNKCRLKSGTEQMRKTPG